MLDSKKWCDAGLIYCIGSKRYVFCDCVLGFLDR